MTSPDCRRYISDTFFGGLGTSSNTLKRMALSLGEKLQQAREARGISISEVAEQTRISSHYLEGIEADDYRNLPGGIFNKGFVKSYAKFVGLDEQEALHDYATLISAQEDERKDDLKLYNPQVLTDEGTASSKISTIVFAVVILGLMTWGVLSLIPYLQGDQNQAVASTPTPAPTAESGSSNDGNGQGPTAPTPEQPLPSTDQIKVEFSTGPDAVAIQATADGVTSSKNVAAESVEPYEADDRLVLRYYRGFAGQVSLKLNGRDIKLPSEPRIKGANGIEFEINKQNIEEILRSGEITFPDAAGGGE